VGIFIYESAVRTEFEDRLLAHLQVVVGTKLRRSEPFYFLWKDESSLGGGRTAVWIHPQANLVFKFHGSRSPAINRAWLDALMHTANSPSGLYVVPEPPESSAAEPLT
jgi:hypothetical protein